MCGRYAITLPPDAVRAFFRYAEQPNFPARYNIAPTQPVPIVVRERSADGTFARHFKLVRWGLIPAWAKDPKTLPLMINARAETMVEKASFRAALIRRRCLFIADAFYEWQRDAGAKGQGGSRPHLVRRADGQPMGLAGLWETWLGADGSELDSACIVTTGANGTMAALHQRMPAILEPKDFETWLSVDEVSADHAARMVSAPTEALELVEIGRDVNKVINDGPELQLPVGASPAMPRETTGDLFS